MPTLPDEPAVAICEFTPITCAALSSSGPPELPGLIGASVWITESISKPLGAWMWRPSPETIPSVAVAVEPERVADRDRRIADLHVARVGELERLDALGHAAGVDAEHGQVARDVRADHGGIERIAARSEAHDHAAVAVHHVRVRHELAVARR